MTVAVLVVVPVAVGGSVVAWRRRSPTRRARRPARLDENAVERAIRVRNEQVAAQARATSMHPDCVRSWMRPR